MEKYYLRMEDNSFGFVLEGIHDIKETDIKITNEEYDKFFKLQTNGKQFKLKESSTGQGLFNHIEEYTPEVIEELIEPGVDEFMLETDFRLSKLEIGV